MYQSMSTLHAVSEQRTDCPLCIRRLCRKDKAVTIAVGMRLATTWKIRVYFSPQFNFTFLSRTNFAAGAQNQWNTYSFPVSTSYLPRYRMKKKTHIFLLRHAILVRVVPCCVTRSWCGAVQSPFFNKYEKVCCSMKISIVNT